ncbi:MAG: Gfo/Idh/MocA family oxidoreductase [Bryobacteraceae bacterium]|nr:Gfo/Idh/MocA family oxidoreductase [Bryobacteraceae bacterium]
MDQTTPATPARREFLKAAGAAPFTTNLFTGRLKGANDKVALGFIGMGAMGIGNLGYAMKIPGFQPVAICDVYRPYLERAQAQAKKGGFDVKAVKDFREIIADRSIDAVCISTPDHWHAYMTVEACKAGKDVYVEKPACVYVEEGLKMVEAARKYQRIVQAGTMQRSGAFFKKAKEIVQSGELGDITFCHTWQAGLARKEGEGKPPDSAPPPDLDWDLWLGPAPKRPFNENRWGISPKRWSTFRYFWDYAGGAMTDWGVHLLDVVHYAFNEVMPQKIVALGGKFYVDDNVETPDTMLATFQYPKFLASYESRTCNPTPMFNRGYGTSFHGTKATLVVNRDGYWIMPVGRDAGPVVEVIDKQMRPMNEPHWQNWLDCIRTRQAPIAEIETCVRSTIPCLLANISMRFGLALTWDDQAKTVVQREARQYLKARYRKPWKLEV